MNKWPNLDEAQFAIASAVEAMVDYIEFVQARIEAGIMPETFEVWFENYTRDDNGPA